MTRQYRAALCQRAFNVAAQHQEYAHRLQMAENNPRKVNDDIISFWEQRKSEQEESIIQIAELVEADLHAGCQE